MKLRDWIFIFLSAISMILAFPPISLGFFAWVGLVPFFFALEHSDWKSAFKKGFLLGILVALGTLYWIGWATWIGFGFVLCIWPLYWASVALLLNWAIRVFGPIAFGWAPVVWVLMEWLSSLGPLAFPWNMVAYTQTKMPVFIQWACFTGALGISFWIVGLNVLLFFLIQTRNRIARMRLILGVILALGIPFLYGMHVLSHREKSEPLLKVGLVQGNVDPYKKWSESFLDSNFVIYDRLSRKLKNDSVDLIVWPETATACFLRHRFVYLNWVKFLADTLHAPILTGTLDYEWKENQNAKMFNSAILVHPHTWTLDIYRKMRLVPFSERVPFSEHFSGIVSFLQKYIPEIGDYSAGDSLVVFSFRANTDRQWHTFSTVICYESVFPYLIQKLVFKGAEFLVIITNDGWFGNTSGPRQHAQIAVLRAIETRRWIVRCANTGISEIIDPWGRVIASTPWNQEAVLVAGISPVSKRTFFVQYPWVFLGMVWIAFGGGVILAFSKMKIVQRFLNRVHP